VLPGHGPVSKIDLTAVVQIFRPARRPASRGSSSRTSGCRPSRRDEKEKADRVPYAAWERAGFVTLTEGDEIDSQAIRGAINRINAVYPIVEIGYDDWNATELSRQLREEDGFGERMVIVRQGSSRSRTP
jgi:phage terminase large subunit-like protein